MKIRITPLCFQLIYRIKQGILPGDLTDTPQVTNLYSKTFKTICENNTPTGLNLLSPFQGELVKLLTAEDPGDRPEAKEIPVKNSLLKQINIELGNLADGK